MTTPEPAGERLARMEAKLDALLEKLTVNDIRVTADLADHETRIRKLERAVWTAAGAGLVGGSAVATVINQLMGG